MTEAAERGVFSAAQDGSKPQRLGSQRPGASPVPSASRGAGAYRADSARDPAARPLSSIEITLKAAHQSLRSTTLILDDDVALTIERLRHEEKMSLKEIVNRALRSGLRQLEAKSEPKAPSRTAEVSLGRCRLGDLVSISETLAAVEGDDFK